MAHSRHPVPAATTNPNLLSDTDLFTRTSFRIQSVLPEWHLHVWQYVPKTQVASGRACPVVIMYVPRVASRASRLGGTSNTDIRSRQGPWTRREQAFGPRTLRARICFRRLCLSRLRLPPLGRIRSATFRSHHRTSPTRGLWSRGRPSLGFLVYQWSRG